MWKNRIYIKWCENFNPDEKKHHFTVVIVTLSVSIFEIQYQEGHHSLCSACTCPAPVISLPLRGSHSSRLNVEHGSEASALLKGSFEEELFLYKKQLRDYELECERCIFSNTMNGCYAWGRLFGALPPKLPRGCLLSLLCYLGLL